LPLLDDQTTPFEFNGRIITRERPSEIIAKKIYDLVLLSKVVMLSTFPAHISPCRTNWPSLQHCRFSRRKFMLESDFASRPAGTPMTKSCARN